MDGILIINKPKGFTSQDAVSKVKKILNIKKAGHTGTLDPMATGVLPILIGNSTKISKYLVEHNKTYIAKIKLGEKSDTGDSEGKIIENKEVNLNLLNNDYIENVLKEFIGETTQIPPMYSAIKVNGKKLYEYAREGINVEIEPRKIEIYDTKLLNIDLNNLIIEFEVSCSKGTYIRTLCEDIAKKLETVGYMIALNRTKVDSFQIENAFDFETLEEKSKFPNFEEKYLYNMEQVLVNLSKIVLSDNKLNLFLNGVMLHYNLQDDIYNIYNSSNEYIGTGTIKNKLLKRDVIIFK